VTETVSYREALLVAGGPLAEGDIPLLAAAVAQTRAGRGVVVAVDGGTHHLLRLGALPDIVTGDFDSLDAVTRADLAAQGVRIVPTPDQDYTDLDKALSFVRSDLAIAQVRVHAASRGRLDHLYSVLSAVVKYGRSLDLRLVDGIGETWLVNGEVTLAGADLPGRTLSLLALGPVSGITTTGVRWPLTEETLAPGVRDGTLNEVVAETVTIRVNAGDLLVNLHHPPLAEI